MENITSEIHDINLSYLMLAQKMIFEDKATAIFRLGLSKEIVDIIENLSPAQILKLARMNNLLIRFRFEDSTILSMLTDHGKSKDLFKMHSAILLANQPVEEIR
jgi:flagellar transcriptional activator FlhD